VVSSEPSFDEEEPEERTVNPHYRTPLYTLDEALKHLFPFFKVCIVCGDRHRHKISLCTGCRAVHYCSRECQAKHWKEGHKDACKGVQVALDLYNKEQAKRREMAERLHVDHGGFATCDVELLMAGMFMPSQYNQAPIMLRQRYYYLLSTLYHHPEMCRLRYQPLACLLYLMFSTCVWIEILKH
jgi:hypothetical protein